MLARILWRAGRFVEAIKYLEQAASMIQSYHSDCKAVLYCHALIVEIAEQKKDKGHAFLFHQFLFSHNLKKNRKKKEHGMCVLQQHRRLFGVRGYDECIERCLRANDMKEMMKLINIALPINGIPRIVSKKEEALFKRKELWTEFCKVQ